MRHYGMGVVALAVVVAPTSLAMAGQGLGAAPAGVEVSHEYGIEFAKVGSPGNAGYPRSTINWTGIGSDRMGRGAVGYEYRIARTEITSAQWLEFLNAFAPRPMPGNVRALLDNEFYLGPSWFGGGAAERDPVALTATYELRTDTPDAAMIPVRGLSWRMAAAYCNWLHNEKSSDWNSLLSGAYDTGTWGMDPDTGGYFDSLEHAPGARFWVPSLDEWAKAAFYDPNRFGPGDEGWWDRHYGMDEPPTPGLPGDPGAQSSTGIPQYVFSAAALDIPLASYPAMSPWGLFDTAGGAAEVVAANANDTNVLRYSVLMLGSAAGTTTLDPDFMLLQLRASTRAFAGGTSAFLGGQFDAGLRIASAVPEPAALSGLILSCIVGIRRRRCD